MQNCNSNLLYVGSGGTFTVNQSFNLATGSGSTGSGVIVDHGTINQAAAMTIGGPGTNCLNFLIVSNGGLVKVSGANNALRMPNPAATNDYGNYILVTDPGSRLNLTATFNLGGLAAPGTLNATTASNGMTVVNSGVVSNTGAIYMSGYETYINIASNGQVWGGTTFNIGGYGLAGTNDTGCGVNLTTGGLLDLGSSSLGVGNVNSANNYLTNNAGILQFSTATPTIALTNSTGGNNITITNGTISFRNIKNADVFMNNRMNQTNGITYQGNNTFMLNWATNFPAAGSNQNYKFSTAYGAANWAGLAMVNGTATVPTTYTNGAVTIESTGWVTFSNAVAVIASNFTCSGTMNVTDSTVTFNTNLTLNSGFTLNLASNTVGNTVNVRGNLSLAANATIYATGALNGNPSAVTLFTVSDGIVGSPSGWTVDKAGYRVKTQGNQIVIYQSSAGAGTTVYFK